jgi:hypothetical protein
MYILWIDIDVPGWKQIISYILKDCDISFCIFFESLNKLFLIILPKISL